MRWGSPSAQQDKRGHRALRRKEQNRPPAPVGGWPVWTVWSFGSERRPRSRQPEATWGRVETAAGRAGGTSLPGEWGGGHSRPGQAAGRASAPERVAMKVGLCPARPDGTALVRGKRNRWAGRQMKLLGCFVEEWVCWQPPCPLPFLPGIGQLVGGGGVSPAKKLHFPTCLG